MSSDSISISSFEEVDVDDYTNSDDIQNKLISKKVIDSNQNQEKKTEEKKNEEKNDTPYPTKFGNIFELETTTKGNLKEKHVQGTVCGVQVSWMSDIHLLDFHDLPEWVKDNEFVKSCYRTELNIKQAFASIFQIHCETGNIWTHLIAAVFSIWLCVFTLLQSILTYDQFVMIVFFFGSTSVYILSFLFHTLYVCSAETHSFYVKLDYIGIVAGIWGGTTSAVLAMFPCSILKLIFVPLLFIVAIVCVIVSVSDGFSSSKYRYIRTSVFVLFGLCGVFPSCAFVFLHWNCFMENEICRKRGIEVFVPLFCVAASFLVGALLYAARIPERWWPGKFDILGHSHQIWHCAIVAGFCSLYYMLCVLLDSKDIFSPECSF